MKIDMNEKELAAMKAFNSGDEELGYKLQGEFLDEFHESCKSEDHCPCKANCRLHGNCLDCVTVHRAHQDHLPVCFHEMINRRMAVLSELTEDSITDYLNENK